MFVGKYVSKYGQGVITNRGWVSKLYTRNKSINPTQILTKSRGPTLKAPITTAADDSLEYIFIVFFFFFFCFQRKKILIFHVNPLLGTGFT